MGGGGSEDGLGQAVQLTERLLLWTGGGGISNIWLAGGGGGGAGRGLISLEA